MSRSGCLLTIVLAAGCGAASDREAPKPIERAIATAAGGGEPRYVGVQRCGQCHDAALAFWNNTPHARAFFTLAKLGKTGDAKCIGCHVTGYGKAGGHQGARAAGLEAVQCEVCHGPGSRHAETESLGAITKAPARSLCRTCHEPPQVAADWDIESAWLKVLGPGHGGGDSLER
jgi:hypothetical protein